ncbi:phosphoribosyl-ATP diphosphatase [Leeia sp.]|uniref:phosphoribosyl-ATP diphosphatase n=1 Tax=Leeia sp. TaxID=2884678 RepID=UPI0035B361FC
MSDSSRILARVAETIATRRDASPDSSYVAKLFSKGPDAVLKKIGEEATEVVLAAKDGDAQHLLYEVADLWFHCMVLLEQHGLRPEQVEQELARREGLSGLAEKAARPTK